MAATWRFGEEEEEREKEEGGGEHDMK